MTRSQLVRDRMASSRQTFLMRDKPRCGWEVTEYCLSADVYHTDSFNICVCVCLHVEVSVLIARLVSQFTTKTAVDILILGFFCLQMTKKILQNEAKIHSSGLFCNLHLLVCAIWHPQETQLLTIWQVWHLQINLWGLWESRGTFSSPTNFDESQDDTIDLLPLLVLPFVLASAFCVSFLLVTSSLNVQPSGRRTDLCPCMHPSCQNSWEQGLDCLCSFQTMFHQMGPYPF